MRDCINRPFSGEELSGVQARGAAVGLVIHPLRSGQAAQAYVVARTAASREFEDLGAVARFVDEWSGGFDAR